MPKSLIQIKQKIFSIHEKTEKNTDIDLEVKRMMLSAYSHVLVVIDHEINKRMRQDISRTLGIPYDEDV